VSEDDTSSCVRRAVLNALSQKGSYSGHGERNYLSSQTMMMMMIDDYELNSQGPITESARIQKTKTQTNIREKQINREDKS
jgi:hypothetical protein